MTRTEPIIRTRADSDLEQLAEVLVQVHATDGYPVEGIDNPRSWLLIDHLLGAWVAEIDRRVVGHVALITPTEDDDAARIWSRQSGAGLANIAVLCRLFVSPASRGHQLGVRLTQTATDAAHSASRTAVLDVMDKDTRAINMYESLGWTLVARIRHEHTQGLREPARVYREPSLGH